MLDLRESALLSSCDEDLYARIVQDANEIDLPAGTVLFDEDEEADGVWMLLDGALEISKRIDGEILPVDHVGAGAYLGEISLLTKTAAGHRATASSDSKVIRIPGELFHELLRTCPSTAHVVVKTLAERVRRIEHMLQKRERLADLGMLAAGLAHELNNPAAAARRATERLLEVMSELPDIVSGIASRHWSPSELTALVELSREPSHTKPAPADPLLRSEKEDEAAEWLEGHGLDDAYEMAACLVEAGMGREELDRLAARIGDEAVGAGIPWLAGAWLSTQLLNEVNQSVGRIGDLVKAIKSYAKADSTTAREVDVRKEVATTLLILRHKLSVANIATTTEFEAVLPTIETYGTELYQVWTNLVDNAVDAMEGKGGGKVTIRARADGDGVAVEVEDNGPGIPSDIVGKIFDPFFTTKDVGKGTGLGLEIVNRIVARHHGRIDVTSVPGCTRFTVVLPAKQRKEST